MKTNKKHSGFTTPEGYFDTFGKRLMERLEKEDGTPAEQDGFQVPEDYFPSFNDRLRERMQAEVTPVISLYRKRTFYYAAASVAALFLLLGVWFTNRPQSTQVDDLAYTEIEAYFMQREMEFSEEELTEYISVDELQVEEFVGDPLEQEQIIDYLDENVEDFEELNITYDEVQ